MRDERKRTYAEARAGWVSGTRQQPSGRIAWEYVQAPNPARVMPDTSGALIGPEDVVSHTQNVEFHGFPGTSGFPIKPLTPF